MEQQLKWKTKMLRLPSTAYLKVHYQSTKSISVNQVRRQKSRSSLYQNKYLSLSILADVLNVTECHYLAPSRNYIVFLESTQTIGAGSTTIYKFANMEEIEVNADTAKNFMDEECADEEDEGIEMTMFFASDKLQCNKFTAKCNG